MGERTPILELLHPTKLGVAQHMPAAPLDILENGRIDFMLRHQIRLARFTSQEVGGDGVSELQRRGGRVLAENDHVDEVVVVGRFGILPEDPAGGEDGSDCSDDEPG